MLEISSEAVQQLTEYKSRRGPESCVRIGILSGTSSGPSLGISMDDANEQDEVFHYDDLSVVVDRALLNYCETIAVEYVLQKGGGCSSGGGFKVVPGKRI